MNLNLSAIENPKNTLAVIWLIGGALIFILMFLMTAGGGFSIDDPNCRSVENGGKCQIDVTRAAWEWFLPTLLPTVSLIISNFVVEASSSRAATLSRTTLLFPLTVAMSIFYLSLILATILSVLIIENSSSQLNRLQWFQMSNLWLAPVQGLTVLAMGAYFINRPEENTS